MTKTIGTALILAGLVAFMPGCGDDPETDTLGDAPGAAATDGALEAPPPGQPEPAAAAAPGTVEGTMDGFIMAIQEERFEDAAALVDPTSEGHPDILHLQGIIQNAREKGLAEIIEATFLQPWDAADYEVLETRENEAVVSLTLGNREEPLNLYLNNVDGRWLIIAPKNLMATPGGGAGVPAPQIPQP